LVADTGWCRSHLQAFLIAASLRALFARRKQSASPASSPSSLFCLFCGSPVFDRLERAKLLDANQPSALEVARADIGNSTG
jgi:hypothetical protein